MHETEPLFLQGSSYTGSPHSMIPKASYWGRKGSVLISLKPTGDWRLVSHSSAMVREIQFAPLEWRVLAAQRHNCNQRHRSAAPDATTPFSLSYGEMQWDIDPNTLPPGGAFWKPGMALGMVKSRGVGTWRQARGWPYQLRYWVIQTAAGQSFQM